MRNFWRTLTAIALLASPLVADDSCTLFGFDVGIDFLYWKPCVDNLDFALSSKDISDPESAAPFNPESGPVKGKYHFLDPRGQGGVRARLGNDALWNGLGFFVSYAYAASADSDSSLELPPGHVWPTRMHGAQMFAGNSASAKYRLHYQAVDALFTQSIICGCCGETIPFFGFDSLYLFQEVKSHGTDVVNNLIGKTKWTSDLYGAGAKVGLEYRYRFVEDIGIYTKISGSVLVSQDHARFKSEQGQIEPGLNLVVEEGEIKFKSTEEIIVPGFALAIGAFYKIEGENMRGNLHIGYEFIQWFNIPSQRRYGASENSLARHYESKTLLGLHGATAGFDISF